jgi:hypothetical protein
MLMKSAVFWGITPHNTPEDRRFMQDMFFWDVRA